MGKKGPGSNSAICNSKLGGSPLGGGDHGGGTRYNGTLDRSELGGSTLCGYTLGGSAPGGGSLSSSKLSRGASSSNALGVCAFGGGPLSRLELGGSAPSGVALPGNASSSGPPGGRALSSSALGGGALSGGERCGGALCGSAISGSVLRSGVVPSVEFMPKSRYGHAPALCPLLRRLPGRQFPRPSLLRSSFPFLLILRLPTSVSLGKPVLLFQFCVDSCILGLLAQGASPPRLLLLLNFPQATRRRVAPAYSCRRFCRKAPTDRALDRCKMEVSAYLTKGCDHRPPVGSHLSWRPANPPWRPR